MLFETCWLYLKNYLSNKKITQHKGCYSALFSFTFNPHIETSQFILDIESGGWFLYELQDCEEHWILVERWLKLGNVFVR